MPLGVSCDGDMHDAVALEQPRFEEREAGVEGADRPITVPADHERAVDTRLARDPGEVIVKRFAACDAPGRDVRDRPKSGTREPSGESDGAVIGLPRWKADVHGRPRLEQPCAGVDLLRISRGKLERRPGEKSGDAGALALQVQGRRRRGTVLGTRYRLHPQSRLREITKDSSRNHRPAWRRSTSRVASR